MPMELLLIAGNTLLRAFLWTVMIEGLVMLLSFHLWKLSCGRGEALYVSFLCNLLTNPALNGLNLIFSLPQIDRYLLEVVVIIVEAAVYRKLLGCGWRKALCLSGLLNAVSYLAGLWLL